MKTWRATCATALAILACATALNAHHSGSMYDPTPLWVKGTVVSFEDVDPHTITTLEDRGADGQIRRWAVEGPGRSQAARLGAGLEVPSVGETLEFCAFPYKSPEELSQIFPGVDFSTSPSSRVVNSVSPQYVWGHVMVVPDGEKRVWNPHGILGECIRSSDEPRQAWVDFINSTPSVRQAWCQQRAYAHVESNASLQELVDEINGLLDDPCG